jgi:tRNA-dihydrouridine synthase
MVSAEGLSREGEKTLELMHRAPNEKQYAIQLFMSNTDSLKQALEQLMPFKPEVIDINCGCPVPKVTKTGAGSAMMKTPSLITEVVRTITDEVDIPVSVKFRTGWDAQSENFLAFAQAALDGGASALTLHARTRSQGYAPFADWTKLTELKHYCTSHAYQVRCSVQAISSQPRMQNGCCCRREGMASCLPAEPSAIPLSSPRQRHTLRQADERNNQAMRVQAILRHLDIMIETYGEKTACTLMRKIPVPISREFPIRRL